VYVNVLLRQVEMDVFLLRLAIFIFIWSVCEFGWQIYYSCILLNNRSYLKWRVCDMHTVSMVSHERHE
jgi:hypothetical protein